jgi:hypothetical protein
MSLMAAGVSRVGRSPFAIMSFERCSTRFVGRVVYPRSRVLPEQSATPYVSMQVFSFVAVLFQVLPRLFLDR